MECLWAMPANVPYTRTLILLPLLYRGAGVLELALV